MLLSQFGDTLGSSVHIQFGETYQSGSCVRTKLDQINWRLFRCYWVTYSTRGICLCDRGGTDPVSGVNIRLRGSQRIVELVRNLGGNLVKGTFLSRMAESLIGEQAWEVALGA